MFTNIGKSQTTVAGFPRLACPYKPGGARQQDPPRGNSFTSLRISLPTSINLPLAHPVAGDQGKPYRGALGALSLPSHVTSHAPPKSGIMAAREDKLVTPPRYVFRPLLNMEGAGGPSERVDYHYLIHCSTFQPSQLLLLLLLYTEINYVLYTNEKCTTNEW
ncbi:hypothetical protein E2C01_059716 [Portunus trituberculatus]|uniref:Uncharacterized protein n=1 Tax=Portunus trituberculatus TaxID=210409 RepID=A0A5B7H968_PORTR|nr:hypothetical protein [Portunus trituberculatus]